MKFRFCLLSEMPKFFQMKAKTSFERFDASYVFIAADSLLFQFCRCRGEFHVSFASEIKPLRFELLEVLLEAVLCPQESKRNHWRKMRPSPDPFERAQPTF
jgi:hypothetical protein